MNQALRRGSLPPLRHFLASYQPSLPDSEPELIYDYTHQPSLIKAVSVLDPKSNPSIDETVKVQAQEIKFRSVNSIVTKVPPPQIDSVTLHTEPTFSPLPRKSRNQITIPTLESANSLTFSPKLQPSSVTFTREVNRSLLSHANINTSSVGIGKKKYSALAASHDSRNTKLGFGLTLNKKLGLVEEGKREYLMRAEKGLEHSLYFLNTKKAPLKSVDFLVEFAKLALAGYEFKTLQKIHSLAAHILLSAGEFD